ncbi:hypothetical protein OQA88_11974 [Cercophora sp. LCS_1]
MRLLNSKTRGITKFISDKQIPKYAILSHTWGEEEVTFQDWQAPTIIATKKGFKKIDLCCQQADKDGLEWVWVDTSSAELSEAINSMFKWYRDSEVCYAYLQDVEACPDESEQHSRISQSRWFTRGWTLQELIAPSDVIFYSEDWHALGTKFDLRYLLHSITGMEPKFLCCEAPLEQASIARRMSWAAKRETSRTEDMAYCLLGIFGINMPLLYGEGKNAFRRLQEELMRAYPFDHTLFAWGKLVREPSKPALIETDFDKLDNLDKLAWDPDEASKRLRGLLADSPHEFLDSTDIAPARESAILNSAGYQPVFPHVVGKGIRMQLYLSTSFNLSVYHWADIEVAQPRYVVYAVLFCDYKDSWTSRIAIPFARWGHDFLGRTDEICVVDSRKHPFKSSQRRLEHIEAEQPYEIQNGDILMRLSDMAYYMAGEQHIQLNSDHGVIAVRSNGLITTPKHMVGTIGYSHFRMDRDRDLSFCLLYSRELTGQEATETFGPINVALVPTIRSKDQGQGERARQFCRREQQCQPIHRHGLTWACTHRTKSFWSANINNHLFSLPEDTWEIDILPFPQITIRLKRVTRKSGDYFDLLDIKFLERKEGASSVMETTGSGGSSEAEYFDAVTDISEAELGDNETPEEKINVD